MKRTINMGGMQGQGDPYMHTKDGGHFVNFGVSFPIEAEEPVPTAEQAMTWPIWVGAGLLFLAFTVFVVQLGVPNWG
jgi:hypothetical protein